MAELVASLPGGYRVAVGGTAEESAKSQASVLAVVPLMLALMLILLMVQLQSFQRLFLVLSVAPLGLIGVVLALLLANKPLGFVAILGVLALVGMIARNSVILIDQIKTESGARAASLGCRRGRHGAPVPSDPPDRGSGDPWDDPDCPDGVLGADGLRDHGRPCGRDLIDAGLPAGVLCGVVPHTAAAGTIRLDRGH